MEVRWATPRAFVEPSLAEKIVIPHTAYLHKAKAVTALIAGLSLAAAPAPAKADADTKEASTDEKTEAAAPATETEPKEEAKEEAKESAKKEEAVKESAKPAAAAGEVLLADGSAVPYDVLVICTGSEPYTTTTRDDRLKFYAQESEKLKAAKSVVVVGGGPSGVELAGEILTDMPGKKITIATGGARVCEFLKAKGSDKILSWLKGQGVDVLLGDRVQASWDQFGSSGTLKTDAGKELTADYVAIAVGARPYTAWLTDALGAAVEDGRVKVDSHLRVEGHSNVFAIGDITNIKENKQGYFAQEHARVAASNIRKVLKSNGKPTTLKSYSPGMDVAIVSLGRKQGLAQLPFGTFMGWVPTNMKSKGLFVNKIRSELGVK
ncbi:unnamed protein product [Closterium sp. Naga37s-1]|nr:unnamed protein product [Closterium sp. Naga37s-1]